MSQPQDPTVSAAASQPNNLLPENPFRAKPRPALLVGRAVAIAVLAVTAWRPAPWSLGASGIILLLLGVTSWGFHALLRANFEHLIELRPQARIPDAPSFTTLPEVTVLSVGRNEADSLKVGLASQAQLKYPSYAVCAIDDRSNDGSSRWLRRLAQEHPCVRPLEAPLPPKDMAGINNAFAFGMRYAAPTSPWLLFTDFRVTFDPDVLRHAVSFAEARDVDFLTCIPYLENGTWVEESLTPIAWKALVCQAGGGNLPALHPVGVGPFMLIRRAMYEAVGGHAGMGGYPYHDALLAARVAQAGGRSAVAWTSSMLRLRQYRGWRDLYCRSVTKLRVVAQDSAVHQCGAALMTLLLMVAPACFALVLLARMVTLRVFGWAAWVDLGLAALIYVDQALALCACRRVCGMRDFVPWTHPVAGFLRVFLELAGAWQSFRRRPIVWRDRGVVIRHGADQS